VIQTAVCYKTSSYSRLFDVGRMPIWHIDSDSIPVKGFKTQLRRKFHVTGKALLASASPNHKNDVTRMQSLAEFQWNCITGASIVKHLIATEPTSRR